MPIRYKKGEQTFTLPCFRALVKALGEFDSLVEYLELANRMLVASFDESKESFCDYLKRLSRIHRINLNDITLQNYKSSLVQGYFVYCDAAFDNFLGGYDKEVRLLTGCEYDLNKFDGCHFEKTVDALKKNSILLQIDGDKKDLYLYYHLLRNDLAHHLDIECTERYTDIKQKKIKSLFPKLHAPNPKSKLCFDDFILCTAIIKDIAFEMTANLLSYIDWAARAVENKGMWFKNYNRYIGEGTERIKHLVYNSLLTRYGIRICEYDLDKIVEKLGSQE